MRLITWIFSFFTGIFPVSGFAQKQEKLNSPHLIPDEQGRMVSPCLIPAKFLEIQMIEHYRLKLAEMLELDGNLLDYSINSMDILEEAKNKEKYKPLLYNWHLYLPILSYVSQVIIRQRSGKLMLKKQKFATDMPENGYHNVYIPSLIIIFNDKGKENISRILGKEFSRMFHYTLRSTVETILKVGTHKKPIFYDYETGEGYGADN